MLICEIWQNKTIAKFSTQNLIKCKIQPLSKQLIFDILLSILLPLLPSKIAISKTCDTKAKSKK
ncbi:hypothetical protein ACWIUD_05640 [Helicobacter sp. 23-1044]